MIMVRLVKWGDEAGNGLALGIGGTLVSLCRVGKVFDGGDG